MAHLHRVVGNHVVRYPQENRCFDALAELYRVLDEGDVLSGCGVKDVLPMLQPARARNTVIGSKRKFFFQGMQNATSGQLSGVSKLKCVTGGVVDLRAQQLNQWDISRFREIRQTWRVAMPHQLALERMECVEGYFTS